MASEHPVTVETLKQILNAFNRHDLDAIMEFFADDCTLDLPRGPDPWGRRFLGKAIGLVIHVSCVGLPISVVVRRFSGVG